MGRQQLRLLLCSIAALALLITALFGMTWFSASLGFGPAIELDLRHARMCQDGICTYVPMGKMHGFFPIAAGIAFWTSLPVLLLLVLQTGARVLTGTANDLFTKIGYFLAGTAFLFGFVAGFLFGPESQSLGELAVVTVERTSAPALFVIGSLLSMIALRLSTAEWLTNDDAGEYKPVVVRKDLQSARLPVTPLTGVKTVTPPSGSAPMAQRTPTPSTPRGRPTTSPPAGRAALPDSLPFDETFTAPPDLDRELPSVDVPRSKTPTGKPLEVSIHARPPSEPPIGHESVRSKSPTGPGPIEIVRTASKAPLSEDDLVGVDQRARTIDLEPQRARTSSSGPVDVAARLSAAAAEASASLTVKPPPPVAEPTPPDEIAVAPESGLRIRKRTPTGGNLPLTREEPVPSIALPEVGLHFKKPSARPGSEPPPQHDAESPLPRKKSASTMPTISADGLADALAQAAATAPTIASPKSETLPPPIAAAKAQTLPPPVVGAKSQTLPPPVVGAKPQTLPPAIAAQTLPPPVAAARTQTLPSPVVAARPQTLPPPVDGEMSKSQPPAVTGTKTLTLPPPVLAARTQTLTPPPVGETSQSQPAAPTGTKTLTLPPPVVAAKSQTLPPAIAAQTLPPPVVGVKSQTLPPPVVAAKTQTLPPPVAAAKTQTLPPPIAARPHERAKTQPPPEATVRPATASGSGSMPAQSGSQSSGSMPATIAEAAQAAAASMPSGAPSPTSSAASSRESSTYSQRFPRTTKAPENKPVEAPLVDATPEALRGKIKYAVVLAELVGAGINARRDDGVSKLVEWGDIVGIVARRFPPGAPYDGATFVDLVSTTGATLRILPWTQIKGLELKGTPAARARGLVNIVAAQSLDAKLDTATKLFADSEGQATQLPDAAALAAHDQRMA